MEEKMAVVDCKSWGLEVRLVRHNLAKIIVFIGLSNETNIRENIEIDADLGIVEPEELEEAVAIYKVFWKSKVEPSEAAKELADAVRNVLRKYIVCKGDAKHLD